MWGCHCGVHPLKILESNEQEELKRYSVLGGKFYPLVLSFGGRMDKRAVETYKAIIGSLRKS